MRTASSTLQNPQVLHNKNETYSFSKKGSGWRREPEELIHSILKTRAQHNMHLSATDSGEVVTNYHCENSQALVQQRKWQSKLGEKRNSGKWDTSC